MTLEISCTSRYRGFESHSLRHQEPVIKPITGSFLFPKRAIPCSFTFSERKSSVLPNINRSPTTSEVAAIRQSKPCLHRLCRGDFRLVIQVGVWRCRQEVLRRRVRLQRVRFRFLSLSFLMTPFNSFVFFEKAIDRSLKIC